jgi:aspartyl protease
LSYLLRGTKLGIATRSAEVKAMNARLCLLWAALLLPQSGFPRVAQGAFPISDGKLPRATSLVEIPFKLYRNYLIVVEGSLGKLERLNFLIDTGVNPTAVDLRIANKLRLTGGAQKLALFNHNTDVRQVVLPSLQLGPIRAEFLPGMIQDLSRFEEVLGVRIDAIVGFGVLSLSSFSIDYRSKKLVFGPIESSPLAVPFDTGPPVLTVQLQVQDEPVRLMLDTGAMELVLFACQLHGRLRQLPVSGMRRFFYNGAGKEIELTEVWLSGVRLGATDFGLQEGFSADDNANCGRFYDGVVGITRLGLKWVAFDFEHQTFSWKR